MTESDQLPQGGHWDSISTANPREDWKKMRDETEAELLGLNTTALSPERLAIAAAMVAAVGQDIPPERPPRRQERRKSLRSSWINDATEGMMGRGWKP